MKRKSNKKKYLITNFGDFINTKTLEKFFFSDVDYSVDQDGRLIETIYKKEYVVKGFMSYPTKDRTVITNLAW